MRRRAPALLTSTSLVRRRDTHRLVPSKHTAASVLTRIADDDAHLADIFDLDQATNERLLAENGRGAVLGAHELVFGVPFSAVVNAAFCHPHPLGARFSGPDRGAWYASFEIKTAQAEVSYHKSVELAEVDWWHESVTYDDYLADFSATFHDLRSDPRFLDCLAPESYVKSQRLAERLVEGGSMGLVYPSVRRTGGTCLACFRPSLVMNVRKQATWRFTWRGAQKPTIARVS